ncbi:MAG: PorT family protein [Prevotellaceae bacterium]|jgi:hypothetical protein|nr:PorT family protein [Prevotellaceae bacterium]
MKKFILIFISLFAAYTTVSAQSFKKDIFGIRAGINSASFVESADAIGINISMETDSRISFHVGFLYQRLLIPTVPLYLETGLYFTEKGFKQSLVYTSFIPVYPPNDIDIYAHSKINVNAMYLKVPLLLNYHFILANNITIQPFAGFYLAYGIGGKMKFTDYSSDKKSANTFSDNGLDRLDLGVRLGVGATFDRIYIGAGYEPGLINVSDSGEDSTTKTKNWAFTIGYTF